jgi:hypothetical protein
MNHLNKRKITSMGMVKAGVVAYLSKLKEGSIDVFGLSNKSDT